MVITTKWNYTTLWIIWNWKSGVYPKVSKSNGCLNKLTLLFLSRSFVLQPVTPEIDQRLAQREQRKLPKIFRKRENMRLHPMRKSFCRNTWRTHKFATSFTSGTTMGTTAWSCLSLHTFYIGLGLLQQCTASCLIKH